jgi:hypothetical protein
VTEPHGHRSAVSFISIAAPRLLKLLCREPKARRLALGLALAAAPQLVDLTHYTQLILLERSIYLV